MVQQPLTEEPLSEHLVARAAERKIATIPRPPMNLPAASMKETQPLPDEPTADAARAEVIDRLVHAWQGRFTYSLSPAGLMTAIRHAPCSYARIPSSRSNSAALGSMSRRNSMASGGSPQPDGLDKRTLRLNLRRLGLDFVCGGAERAPFSLIEGEVSHDD